MLGVFSLCLKTSLPIMHSVIAVQCIFLSLGSSVDLHPIVSALLGMKFVMGFNDFTFMIPDYAYNTEFLAYRNIRSLGYTVSFFQNFNVMHVLQIVALLTAGFVFLLSLKNTNFRSVFIITQR